MKNGNSFSHARYRIIPACLPQAGLEQAAEKSPGPLARRAEWTYLALSII